MNLTARSEINIQDIVINNLNTWPDCRWRSHPGIMDAGFHTLMAEVGYYGPFQKTFTVVFIFLHAVVLGMQYLNIVLAMTVPEHWCHVPGRRKTNLSLVEWKEVTVPRYFRDHCCLQPWFRSFWPSAEWDGIISYVMPLLNIFSVIFPGVGLMLLSILLCYTSASSNRSICHVRSS